MVMSKQLRRAHDVHRPRFLPAALLAVLLLPACLGAAHRMNQPSAEQQAQADATQQQSCVTSAQMLWDTFCDHPPKTVIPAYVDNAKTARNSLAPTCKVDPAPLKRLDVCIAELETRE